MKPSELWKRINEEKLNPPVNLNRLADALGAELREAYLSDDISGMLERTNGRYVITVNAKHHTNRKRFTIAHELGHLMLHKDLIGEGVDDDRAYRSTDAGKYHNTKIGPPEETEANRFAANLLMPRDLVQSTYRELGSVQETAKRFGVSEHAMSIRLGLPYEA